MNTNTKQTTSSLKQQLDNLELDNLNPLYNAILIQAAKEGNTEVIQFAIEKGADVNTKDAKGNTPLHLASKNGHVGAINKLLEKVAEVNTKDAEGNTPLHLARDAKGNTPLHLASKNGHVDAIKTLLEKGADVNAKDAKGKDAKGNTPLHLAIKNEHVDAIKTLLEKGADVNAKDADGKSPIYLVQALHNFPKTKQAKNNLPKTKNSYLDTFENLIEAGADPRERPSYLHSIISWHNVTESMTWGAFIGSLTGLILGGALFLAVASPPAAAFIFLLVPPTLSLVGLVIGRIIAEPINSVADYFCYRNSQAYDIAKKYALYQELYQERPNANKSIKEQRKEGKEIYDKYVKLGCGDGVPEDSEKEAFEHSRNKERLALELCREKFPTQYPSMTRKNKVLNGLGIINEKVEIAKSILNTRNQEKLKKYIDKLPPHIQNREQLIESATEELKVTDLQITNYAMQLAKEEYSFLNKAKTFFGIGTQDVRSPQPPLSGSQKSTSTQTETQSGNTALKSQGNSLFYRKGVKGQVPQDKISIPKNKNEI